MNLIIGFSGRSVGNRDGVFEIGEARARIKAFMGAWI